MRYSILQANLTSSGYGDYWEISSTDSLEEAVQIMNKIYRDTKGITKYPNGYIDTTIIDNSKYFDDFDYFVDSKQFYY